jgi:hypothetical protein
LYVQKYEHWVETGAILREQLLTLRKEKWELEKKYKIAFEAYSLGKSLKGTGETIEKTEDYINKQFEKLSALVDKIDVVLAPLPIVMQPDTANFGITAKNPKPLTKIDEKLDENINTTVLNKISEPFKLKNNDMLSSDYNSLLSKSVINYTLYRTTLLASYFSVVEKDAFPSYQNLKISNIPWISFLYKNWVTVGARQYGFPGQLPFPV